MVSFPGLATNRAQRVLTTCRVSHSEYMGILFRTQVSASSHHRVPFCTLAALSSLDLSFPFVE